MLHTMCMWSLSGMQRASELDCIAPRKDSLWVLFIICPGYPILIDISNDLGQNGGAIVNHVLPKRRLIEAEFELRQARWIALHASCCTVTHATLHAT